MPSVQEITEAVRSGRVNGKPFNRHTDGRYYTCENVLPKSPDVELRLINDVHKLCERSLGPDTNYEDIAYVLWQVWNAECGEYENPAIVPLLQRLRGRFGKEALFDVAKEAWQYVLCVIESMLSRQAELGHMSPLIEATRSRPLDVFTLNHDTVIEQELENAKIENSDGFDLQKQNVAYWDFDRAVASRKRVRFYKLHGSLGWRLFRPDPHSQRQYVGRAIDGDIDHTADFGGTLQWPVVVETNMPIPVIASEDEPSLGKWVWISRQGREHSHHPMAQIYCRQSTRCDPQESGSASAQIAPCNPQTLRPMQGANRIQSRLVRGRQFLIELQVADHETGVQRLNVLAELTLAIGVRTGRVGRRAVCCGAVWGCCELVNCWDFFAIAASIRGCMEGRGSSRTP